MAHRYIHQSEKELIPGATLPFVGFVAYKHVALFLLVAQTVGAILVMRVSRTVLVSRDRPYLSTTAVVMAELVKAFGSLVLVIWDNEWDVKGSLRNLYTQFFSRPLDTLLVGVPALLYTIQNNLLFIALSNMSGALYQVTYQLKVLTTALLAVIILHKHICLDKWLSLFLLTAGVACIQLSATSAPPPASGGGNVFVGTVAVLLACVTSAFAGVYLEKILKSSEGSIWSRNIQLALVGSVLAGAGSFWKDGPAILEHGFFQGYNWATWLAILMQSAGGLIVAAVLKFADNILKCFGNAVAIILSCLISYYFLNDFSPNVFFVFGAGLVVFATYAYGMNLPIVYRLQHPHSMFPKYNLLF